MPYFITSACLDVKDMSCVEECPVDCIYEGDRKLYINPKECIDCGACQPVCPVSAIQLDRSADAELDDWKTDNARFFTEALPGKDAPLGNPGGARKVGRIGVDTELAVATTAAG
ncbi:ferredoxin [Saccharopolyspora sp. 5N708]|uniref:ferredoxin n=1 Tax=Saccharopolyspora sp. 5N708 TaxID=3457424 RepID=UPI003FD53AB4